MLLALTLVTAVAAAPGCLEVETDDGEIEDVDPVTDPVEVEIEDED
jgi:hypothetical protein